MNAYSWTFPHTFNNFTTLVTVCLIWYLELSDTNVDKNSEACIHMSSASLGAPGPISLTYLDYLPSRDRNKMTDKVMWVCFLNFTWNFIFNFNHKFS